MEALQAEMDGIPGSGRKRPMLGAMAQGPAGVDPAPPTVAAPAAQPQTVPQGGVLSGALKAAGQAPNIPPTPTGITGAGATSDTGSTFGRNAPPGVSVSSGTPFSAKAAELAAMANYKPIDWWKEVTSDPFGFLMTGTDGIESKHESQMMSEYARQSAEAAAQQRQARIEQASSLGMKGREAALFVDAPDEYYKNYGENMKPTKLGKGERAINGAGLDVFNPDTGLGKNDQAYYTTSDGKTVWGEQGKKSYSDIETERNNRERNTIDRDRLAVDRKKAETDALAASLPNFGNENQLRNQYLGQTAAYQSVRSAADRVRALSADTNPAEQMALVFSVMKMLDPQSTVRESEVASAENTTSAFGAMWNAWNKAKEGKGLNAQQIADFRALVHAQEKAAETKYVQTLDTYRGFAERYKMDPSIIQDMRPEQEKPKPNMAQQAITGLGDAVKGIGGMFMQPGAQHDDGADLLNKWNK